MAALTFLPDGGDHVFLPGGGDHIFYLVAAITFFTRWRRSHFLPGGHWLETGGVQLRTPSISDKRGCETGAAVCGGGRNFDQNEGVCTFFELLTWLVMFARSSTSTQPTAKQCL